MGRIYGRSSEKRAFSLPPIPPYPGASGYGYSDDYYGAGMEEASLRVPTVWACVTLLANTISMLPIETFLAAPLEVDGVSRKVLPPQVIQNPELQRTQGEWIHSAMVSVLMRGNAYGIKTFKKGTGTGDEVGEVILLHPDFVEVLRDEQGRKMFRVHTQLGMVDYDSDEMWHLPGLVLPGQFEGLSPIAYAKSILALDVKSRSFARDYFDGNAMPKAVVTHEKSFNQEQAAIIKDKVLSAMQGRDPLVLGGNLKFTPIPIKPEESQFLETQQANVAQIARYFGIPAEMVGGPNGGNSMTYKNVEQRNLDFLTYSVQFWLKRFEDSLSVLLPKNQVAKFDVNPLLRTDVQTRATVDNMRIAGKVMTPDEIRAQYNLPPLTEEQRIMLDLVPMTPSPLGGMKGIPKQVAQEEAQETINEDESESDDEEK